MILSSIIILQHLCLLADQRLIENDSLLGRAWWDVVIYAFRLWLRVSSAFELYRIRHLNSVRMRSDRIDVCFDGSLN